jgi:hypothetical protein
MEIENTNQVKENNDSTYDRNAEVKAFDESKAGVRGLIESGITKIPRMFINPEITNNLSTDSKLSVPIIDLKDIHNNNINRVEIINQVKDACKKWGFFQVINHGISVDVLDEMIDGIQRFHEQDVEVRKKFYTRDFKKKFFYYSNSTLYRDKFALWRDSVGCSMAPNPPKPEELPQVFR